MLQGCQLLAGAEFYVAIDNKGLWPQLVALPSGEIAAFVYNEPSHGVGHGDVEMWVSRDDGRSWAFRSQVSDHAGQPQGVRMNHASGVNARGEPVVLVSGYRTGQDWPPMRAQLCRSKDMGATWERSETAVDLVPFGRMALGPDGRLWCGMYRFESRVPRRRTSHLLASADGSAWDTVAGLEGNMSETALLRPRSGAWLAAARVTAENPMDSSLPHGQGVRLFRSLDQGASWDAGVMISPQGQDNADLLELADGRIVCAFTSRIPGLFGVTMRVSSDGGATWSLPKPLITCPATDWRRTDCGYPSSVQRADGTVVTACYFGPKKPEWASHTVPWHQRYHMCVARWRPSSL